MLKKLKRQAELLYDRERIAKYGNDKSKTWQHINEIMKRKKKSRTVIKSIRDKNGIKITEPKKIADCLNEHFSTVGKTMAEKLIDQEGLKDPLDYIKKRIEESIEMTDSTTSEILKLIVDIDAKKACGFDEINNKIIKKTSEIVAPFLKTLFNACMQQGIYPDCFKTAQVTPLFKGGDTSKLGNYRPISLLPVIGKLL